jgi:hypothetical protein
MGFLTPAALLATARAVIAADGACNATCDRDLHRTVSMSVDKVPHPMEAFVLDLHSNLTVAKAAIAARLVRDLPEALQSDTAELTVQMANASFAPGAGLLVTMTTGNTHRWRMFINWLAFAVQLRTQMVVFVSDVKTVTACETALQDARVAFHNGTAAPMLCFYPAATLDRFDLVPGMDDWKDVFWMRITNIMKPASLTMAVSVGARDVVFVETDVVLRVDVLAYFRARPDTATLTCMSYRHNATKLPEGNVGVLFFRNDTRVRPLLLRLLLRCATAWETSNDQTELIGLLAAARDAAENNGTFVLDCVDGSDGFTSGCRSPVAPETGIVVHAACLPNTLAKIEWLKSLRLWHHAHDLPSPPPPAPLSNVQP